MQIGENSGYIVYLLNIKKYVTPYKSPSPNIRAAKLFAKKEDAEAAKKYQDYLFKDQVAVIKKAKIELI